MIINPGEYIICDPCYIIGEDNWNEYLDSVIKYSVKYLSYQDLLDNGHDVEGILNPEKFRAPYIGEDYVINPHYKKKKVFAHNTIHGDGIYNDQFGNIYPVDSGILGITPVELTDESLEKKEEEKFGAIFTFNESFECKYENGTFYFGNIIIKTDEGKNEK